MFQKFIQILKIKELRGKILFVLAMLVVFRAAAAIPIPGVDTEKLKALFESNQFFGLLNIFSGGGFDKLSIIMLGVAPFITASIIFQLLTMIFPKLKEMYYESGEQGRQKFNQYSRLLTVPLGVLQAYALIVLLQRQQIIENLGWFYLATNIVVVVAGTVFFDVDRRINFGKRNRQRRFHTYFRRHCFRFAAKHKTNFGFLRPFANSDLSRVFGAGRYRNRRSYFYHGGAEEYTDKLRQTRPWI